MNEVQQELLNLDYEIYIERARQAANLKVLPMDKQEFQK
jgi:hypothetical protein